MEQLGSLLDVEVEIQKEVRERRMTSFSFSELLSKADIEKVAQSLCLKKDKTYSNKNHYYYKCPFHNEKNPSFMITLSKQKYHCFGCSEDGDIISLVRKIKRINFIQSLFYIKKVCGIKEKIQFENIIIKERIAYLLSDFNKSNEVFEEKQEILENDDYYLRYLDENEK